MGKEKAVMGILQYTRAEPSAISENSYLPFLWQNIELNITDGKAVLKMLGWNEGIRPFRINGRSSRTSLTNNNAFPSCIFSYVPTCRKIHDCKVSEMSVPIGTKKQ